MRKKSTVLIALAIISLASHFAYFGHPNQTVFDEVHFGKFVSAYYTGQYYFDIHPPLGKLIIAGFAKLFGFRPEFSFANIGEPFPDHLYLALRFLPTLAGALVPLVLYALALQVDFSRRGAFLLGFFLAIENAFLVQTRFILLDAFLLLFGFSALWCYARWRNSESKYLLAAAGTLGTLAIAIKWTGATFLAIIVALELYHLWQDRRGSARKRIGPLIISFIAVPAVLYCGVFWLHFSLLPRSGTGDAFMSARFQHGLTGNVNAADTSLRPLGLLDKVIELNREMYRANARLTATHPYSSRWYSWPFITRPVFYWINADQRIYLLPNPLLWWASTAAVFIALVEMLVSRERRRDRILMLLLAAWALNLLPFIGIGRVMFLYHYLVASVFAIAVLVRYMDQTRRWRWGTLAFIGLCIVSFLYFAPLTYGTSLSPKAYEHRVWLNSWR